jgi:hypothetical protein
MRTKILLASLGIILGFIVTPRLRADQLVMQNGDRYNGKVLSVSADAVVLQNEVLGKIAVPRDKVAGMAFGTNAASPRAAGTVAPVSVPTNILDAASMAALVQGNTAKASTNLPATRQNLNANADLARQIREQMLAGNPEVAAKYDELVSGYMSGKLNLNDLRREAKSAADQLRTFKRELGPQADDALDAYLEVLDGFLKETAGEPASAKPARQPKAQGR